jgi:hypothetical protein
MEMDNRTKTMSRRSTEAISSVFWLEQAKSSRWTKEDLETVTFSLRPEPLFARLLDCARERWTALAHCPARSATTEEKGDMSTFYSFFHSLFTSLHSPSHLREPLQLPPAPRDRLLKAG